MGHHCSNQIPRFTFACALRQSAWGRPRIKPNFFSPIARRQHDASEHAGTIGKGKGADAHKGKGKDKNKDKSKDKGKDKGKEKGKGTGDTKGKVKGKDKGKTKPAQLAGVAISQVNGTLPDLVILIIIEVLLSSSGLPLQIFIYLRLFMCLRQAARGHPGQLSEPYEAALRLFK